MLKKCLLGLAAGCCIFFFGLSDAAEVKTTAPANSFTTVLMKPSSSEAKPLTLTVTGTGIIGENLIVAGGLDLGDKAQYSKNVYAALLKEKQKRVKWVKVGELPEPIAYTANVTGDKAVYLIGGSNASGDKAGITELKLENNAVKCDVISYLPVTITKSGGAKLGDYVYIVGGLHNGKASNDMYRLNLQNVKKGWEKLAPYPENPRVQPIVAVQKDASGKEKLFFWGGYTPKQGNNKAVISCGGYKYDPATNKWKALGAPLDSEGKRIYLGAGIAAPLGEDQIVAVGGHNFENLQLELGDKPLDYHKHEKEWYKLNQEVFSYNTVENKWNKLGTHVELAKINAGAAVKGKTLYSILGETKPGTACATVARLEF